jgi:glycosyltransferase involved in cell wall biosynthesis
MDPSPGLVGASSADRSAQADAARVGSGRWRRVACLSSAPWNPYLRLLYRHLADCGLEPVPGGRLTVSWLWKRRGDVGFLHVHWPEGLYRLSRGPRLLRPALSWVKLALFAVRLAWARLLGYRLVWTVHQLYPHEREGRVRDALAVRLLGRACSLLLAHDTATAMRVREALPGAERRIHVVAHGSYIGVYPPGRRREVVRAELGIPEDAFVFLTFGELRAYKEVDLLLDAFRSTPIPRARLVIAGHPKDPRVASSVREAARADPRIVPLLGWVAEETVAELFAACDVAVVARGDGGTSGSLILAMSLQLPVVAADRPAYRELLDGGQAGWLFAAGDVRSLRGALLQAADDGAAVRERGRRASEAAKRLSWPDSAARTAALLRAVGPGVPPGRGLLGLAGSPRLAWLVIALGAALRLAQYASGRSLWLDESYLALNVLARSYSDLLGTLDYAQGAPPGFLLTVKLLSDALGSGEEVLRALPLAAGLLSLLLFHKLARLTLAPAAANVALLLFAASGGLIRYSSELKPYEVDVATVLLVSWLALARWRERVPVRDGLLLGAVGLIAVLFSYAAVFALAAVVAAALVRLAIERRREAVPGLAAAFAPWLAALVAVYVLLVPTVRDLQETVFTSFYLPLPPSSWGDLRRLVGAAADLFTDDVALGLPLPVALAAAALALLGSWPLARRSPLFLLLAASLLGSVVLASGLHRYPWGGRFTLFLVPFAILAAAAGIGRVAEGGRGSRLLASALGMALLAVPLGRAAYHLVQPRTLEEMRPLVRRLGAGWRQGDALYLNASAQYAFRYYSQYRGMAERGGQRLWPVVPAPGGRLGTSPALLSAPPSVVVGRVEEETPAAVARRVAALSVQRRRVWVLLAHLRQGDLHALPGRLAGSLRRESVIRHGAALFLYQRE